MSNRRGPTDTKTYFPDRSRPNPNRRPLAKRQTTARAITFVRNWENGSPIGQLSFNLNSILERSGSSVTDLQGPVAVVSPVAQPQLEHDSDKEGDLEDEDNDEYFIPATQEPPTKSSHRPVEFDSDDERVIPDSQPVSLGGVTDSQESAQTPVLTHKSKRTNSSTKLTQVRTPSSAVRVPVRPILKTPGSARRLLKGQVSITPIQASRVPRVIGQLIPLTPQRLLKEKETETRQSARRISKPEAKQKKGRKSVLQLSVTKNAESIPATDSPIRIGSDLMSVDDKQDEEHSHHDNNTNSTKLSDHHHNTQPDKTTDILDVNTDDPVEHANENNSIFDVGDATVGAQCDIPSETTSKKRRSPRRLSSSRRLFTVKNTNVPTQETPRLSLAAPTPTSFRVAVDLANIRSGRVSRKQRKRIPSETQRNETVAKRPHLHDESYAVRLWQGHADKRKTSDVTDLDIMLNCFEEVAWEIRQKEDSLVLKKALNAVAKRTQQDLRETIGVATSAKKICNELHKSQLRLARARNKLCDVQRKHAELQHHIALSSRGSKHGKGN